MLKRAQNRLFRLLPFVRVAMSAAFSQQTSARVTPHAENDATGFCRSCVWRCLLRSRPFPYRRDTNRATLPKLRTSVVTIEGLGGHTRLFARTHTFTRA